jgi:hypothetical protein
MSTVSFLYTYIAFVLFLWSFLGLSTLILFREGRLRRKGYAEPFIVFLRKDNRRRCLGIGITMPLIALLAAGVVLAVFGEISTYQHFMYICLGTIVGIIPFPILDSIRSNRKHKALVMDTRQTVVIDLNYRVWHLVFKPSWELILALAMVGYFIWIGQYFNLAMLHIAILWLLYLAGRNSRFMTGPSLADLYQYNFFFMVINHLLVAFHLVRLVLLCCPVAGRPDHVIGILLIAAWAIKLLIYLVQLPQFRQGIAELTHGSTRTGVS